MLGFFRKKKTTQISNDVESFIGSRFEIRRIIPQERFKQLWSLALTENSHSVSIPVTDLEDLLDTIAAYEVKEENGDKRACYALYDFVMGDEEEMTLFEKAKIADCRVSVDEIRKIQMAIQDKTP